MPANTPRGYTYPLYSDPANFPAQMADFAGDVDADVQSLVDQTTAALNQPSARVSAGANQLIPAGVLTPLVWTLEEYDNAAMANLGVNNDRITFTSTGIYLVQAEANFTPNGNATVGGRGLRIAPNLSPPTIMDTRRGSQTSDTEVQVTDLLRVVTVGDFVRIEALHDSGAAVNVSARSFSVTKVSDL